MVSLRALLGPLAFPACVVAGLGLPDSFFPNFTLFLLFPLAFVSLAIWTLIHLVRAVRAGWHRNWSVGASHITAIVIAVILYGPIERSFAWVSRYLHLATFVAIDAISPFQPDKREGRVDVFDWGGQGLAAGASEMRFLVRDPIGKARAAMGNVPVSDYPGASIETRHLMGNYYLRILHYP